LLLPFSLQTAIGSYFRAILKRLATRLNAKTAMLRADVSSSRKSILKSLDLLIEKIELRLRLLIVIATEGDINRLPPHVKQKIDERLHSQAKKNAALYVTQYEDLLSRLEFSDLRELQDITLSKTLWVKFETRFGNKEALATKFDQIAGLRNGIRHSRSVDEITQKEGETGIIWFERVLRK
jgi:hypothetical protein